MGEGDGGHGFTFAAEVRKLILHPLSGPILFYDSGCVYLLKVCVCVCGVRGKKEEGILQLFGLVLVLFLGLSFIYFSLFCTLGFHSLSFQWLFLDIWVPF